MTSSRATYPRAKTNPARTPTASGFFVPIGQVVDEMLARESLGIDSHSRTVASSWGDFLDGWEFQWFCNMTFTDRVHPEKADKLFRIWAAKLDERNIGGGWSRPNKRKFRCTWVRGLEWQKRDVLHYHALVGNLPSYRIGLLDRELQMEQWETLDRSSKFPVCGFARIWPITDQHGAAQYITKYCTKSGEVDVSAHLVKGVSNAWPVVEKNISIDL